MKIFPVPAAPGLSGTGTGTCLSPTMTKAPATRYRNAQFRMGWGGGLSVCRSCCRPALHVPDTGCDWLVLSQARHVARCTLHVAGCRLQVPRCSLLVTRRSLAASGTGGPAGPATQSVRRVQGLQAQNHPEGEMQLHVLHHMDDRGSHEVMVIIDQ